MTIDEARGLKHLVGKQVTLVTKKDSVYVGTLACAPHHGQLLLTRMCVYHKCGVFKACSGSASQNKRLFNLYSVKDVSLAQFVAAEDLPNGIFEMVKTRNAHLFRHQFPGHTGMSEVLMSRVPNKTSVFVRHPDSNGWTVGTLENELQGDIVGDNSSL